jgi:hypothetical protein
VILIFLAFFCAEPGVVRAETPEKRVLVIYTTQRDTQFSIAGDQMIPRLLEAGVGAKIDYYAEHIDSTRFPEESYTKGFRDYLQRKYRDARLDAIIVTHTLAFDFMAAHRGELFPATQWCSSATTRRATGSATPPASLPRVTTVPRSTWLARFSRTPATCS